MVRNREHVVSKDELLDAVWAGRIVSESTLTSHINAARKAIGDSGQNQRLLRTIIDGQTDLDEFIEVSFSVSPQVRRLALLDVDNLSIEDLHWKL